MTSDNPSASPSNSGASGRGGRGSSIVISSRDYAASAPVDGRAKGHLNERFFKEASLHEKALEKLGVHFDHDQFVNHINDTYKELEPVERQRNFPKLANLIEHSRKYTLAEGVPLTEELRQQLQPSAKELKELRAALSKKAKECDAAIKGAATALEKEVAQGGDSSWMRELVENGIAAIRTEFNEFRESLVNKAAYGKFLKGNEDAAKHLYHAPAIRDGIAAQLNKDLKKFSALQKEVGDIASITMHGDEAAQTRILKAAEEVLEQAARKPKGKQVTARILDGKQAVLDHIRSFTGLGADRNKIGNHIEDHFELRGVDKITIHEHELDNLLKEYGADVLKRSENMEDLGFSFSRVSKEVRNFADNLFKKAEHDGAKTVGWMTRMGVDPGRVAVGAAGIAAESAGSYWASRVRQQENIEQSTLIADENGNVQPANKKNHMLEFMGATAVTIGGFYAVIDALMDGPLSKLASNLFKGGRGR